MITLCVVILIPLVYAFFLSFYKTQGLESTFVGLSNYADILKQEYFWSSTGRTAYFTVVSVSLEFILGMLVALILPWALPTVVNGVLSWIFNSSYGSLMELGIIDKYISWLGEAKLAMNCVILLMYGRTAP